MEGTLFYVYITVTVALFVYFQSATFQLVLATDGIDSYLMYFYEQNKMNWVQWSSIWTPPILVGFTVKGGQHYKVHPLSFTSLALQMDQYAETNGIVQFLISTPRALVRTDVIKIVLLT